MDEPKTEVGYALKWGEKYAAVHRNTLSGRGLSFGSKANATRFDTIEDAKEHTKGFEDFKLKIVELN